VITMDELCATELPHLYGPEATHQCEYREKLEVFLRRHVQDQTTDFIACAFA
jgi:hypothetical protein